MSRRPAVRARTRAFSHFLVSFSEKLNEKIHENALLAQSEEHWV